MKLTSRKIISALVITLIILPRGLTGQNHEHSHEHNHGHQHPEHPRYEIGVGNYLSYLAGEQEIAYSLHVHFLRSFEESRFGFGLGYEHIFDEHVHRSLGIIGTYRLSPPLIFSLSPGILFPTEENQDVRFVLHSEAVYEFELNHFHIGPALGLATSFEESHFSIGLHFAYAF